MWRPIKHEDIQRGLVVDMFGARDNSPWGCGTVVSCENNGNGTGSVKIARPIAYASELTNNNSPLLYAEVVETTVNMMVEREMLVWVDRDNSKVRTAST